MNLPGAGIVAGVMPRVKINFLKARDTGPTQSFLAGAGRGDGQTQHTDHSGCLHAAEMRCTPGDRLGGDSSLTVRWPREWQHRFLTREHVLHFDDIAHGPDLGIRSSHLRINDDASART